MVRTRTGEKNKEPTAAQTTKGAAQKDEAAARSLGEVEPPTSRQGAVPHGICKTTKTKMAQAEQVGIDYKSEFAQMAAAMSSLNQTLVEMNKGLTLRLDGLTDRMEKADVSAKQVNVSTEEDRKQTNVKLQKLENLLLNSEANSKEISRKLKQAEARLAASEGTKKQLLERINFIENRTRICNLIIDGCPESEGENLMQYVVDLANCLAKSQVNEKNVVAVYRIGKKQVYQAGDHKQVMRPRPIKMILDNLGIRNEIYYARASLKSVEAYKRIYVGDDVTLDTKKAREDYRSVAALARSLKAEVKVHDDGIIIQGRKYRIFEAATLPVKYSLKKAKTIEVNGAIYFHSEHSALSNFCNSPMIIEETAYLTAEHRLQYLKCVMTNNLEIAERIIVMPTALEAKRLGDTVRETPEWREQRDRILEEVLMMKFSQNEELARELVRTEGMKLNEATVNMYYGIGASLHSREVRDGTHKGANKLGKTLEIIRSRLIENERAGRVK